MGWITAEKNPGKTGKQWCDRCDARVAARDTELWLWQWLCIGKKTSEPASNYFFTNFYCKYPNDHPTLRKTNKINFNTANGANIYNNLPTEIRESRTNHSKINFKLVELLENPDFLCSLPSLSTDFIVVFSMEKVNFRVQHFSCFNVLRRQFVFVFRFCCLNKR